MRNLFVGLSLLAGPFLFSTCDLITGNSNTGFSFDEQTFTNNWDEWKNRDIQNYSFTMTGQYPYWNYRAIYMYDYEVNITVKNGIMDSFEYTGNTPYEEYDSENILEPEFTSISDVYQKIYHSAQEEKAWWNEYSGDGHIISTKFDITYNATWNYITFYEPVSEWKSGTIVDTTAHPVKISNFKLLE